MTARRVGPFEITRIIRERFGMANHVQKVMTYMKRSRLRFSIKTLMAAVTLLAVFLGGWIAYSNYKINQLTTLRQQGAIVIIRDGTPKSLQRFGITHLSPFYSVPTVELYVTPLGADASIGNSEEAMPIADAQKHLVEKAAEARSYGAEDIQLGVIGSFDQDWMKFGIDNRMSAIGESKQRYIARLEANQESGANINP